MKKGGIGGGNTITGINFEGEVDFLTIISKQKGYFVNGHDVFYNDKNVAQVFKKHSFYGYLKSKGTSLCVSENELMIP